MYKNENLKKTIHARTEEKLNNFKTLQKPSSANVEEKYIENLHKQIHFMNLEISLLKDKQKKNKGFFGLQTMMGGKLEPPTEHLIQAKTKFNELDKKIKEQIINLENEILRKKESIVYFLNVNNEMRQFINSLNEEYKSISHDDLNSFKNKLDVFETIKIELVKKQQRLEDQLEFTQRENLRLTKLKREDDLKEEIRLDLLEKEKNRKNDYIDEMEKTIENLKNKKTEYEQMIQNNPQLQNFVYRNAQIENLLEEKEIINDDLEYKIYELQELKKLSVINKTQQNEEISDLSYELDRLNGILQEEKKIIKNKIERKFIENENELINKKKTNLRIEENELEEAKRKWKNIHNIYNQYKIETMHLFNKKTDLEKSIQEKNNKCENLKNQNSLIEPEVKKLLQKNEIVIDEESQLLKKKENLKKEVLKLNLELAGLNSRINFIKENFDLSEVISKIKLEDLKKVVNTNNDVNSTINDFINKWDNVKNFSK